LFLIDILELLFGGAMASLVLDIWAKRQGRWREWVVGGFSTAVIASALLWVVANWAPYVAQGTEITPVPSPVASLYVVDRFTIFVIFTALVVGVLVSAYSLGKISQTENAGPFHALLLLLLGALVGVVSAGDLLTLFLFWEAMSLSAYGLVSFRKGSALSLEASLKYFFMAGIGSLLAFYGISMVYLLIGNIRLDAIVNLNVGQPIGAFAILTLLVGFGVEAAIVPLHTWLPDVYSAASTPVAAVVSGAVTGTGIFVLAKILEPLIPGVAVQLAGVEELQTLLALLAVVTMLVGNLGALAQPNLRRMLGYSSIAQTGYMLAALSTFTLFGVVAVVFTIWNHGILKSNMFMLTGSMGEDYEDSEFERLKGAGRKNRLLGFLFGSATLAIVGAPPFGLFWSEIFIVRALLIPASLLFLGLAVAVVLNIVLSIGYYYRIINVVVFGPREEDDVGIKRSSLLPPTILLLLSLASGLVPTLILSMLV
jgi:proton-translocating NADH-quinone oxidoreductase chain N